MHTHTTLHTVKAATALLAPLLLLCSCAEDYITADNGTRLGMECDYICFGIAPTDELSRSASAPSKRGSAANFVLRSADSADTLCVRMSTTDFGPLPFSANAAPSTRAACLSGSEMHGSFGVTACLRNADGDKGYYFFNEENSKPDNYDVSATGVWEYTSGNIYYWPGAGNTLQFYAHAPYSADGLDAPVAASPGDPPSLRYSVPSDASKQTDLVASATQAMPGDTNEAVPLKFDHICTAVEFAASPKMPQGTIHSITIKGAYCTGVYSFEPLDSDKSSAWTLDHSYTADFVHEINKEVGPTEQGADITSPDDCFILMPQTLPEGAVVEVVFKYADTGLETTFTAPIAGQVWEQGERVRYTLSIAPESGLQFLDEPQAQDAHYVIYPLKLSIGRDMKDGWTLTSNQKDRDVTFVESGKFLGGYKVEDFVKEGYWIDYDRDAPNVSYRGKSTLKSNTIGEVTVYVFLTENVITDENKLAADREIILTLSPDGQEAGQGEPVEFKFVQYCPNWYGDLGTECIQDQDYPWGFDWKEDDTVTYSLPWDEWKTYYNNNFALFFGNLFSQDNLYIFQEHYGDDAHITIDYSKVWPLTAAEFDTDNIGGHNTGGHNTWITYVHQEVDDVPVIMLHLEEHGGKRIDGHNTHPEDFAVAAAAKKNKFCIHSNTHEWWQATEYRVSIIENEMVWYLPSQDEASQMVSDPLKGDPLQGDYWTSTTDFDTGTQSYKYTAGGTTSLESRNRSLHVRAVRRRPANTP